MTEGFSEAEARMLDRFGPPPLAAGFADRVAARLPADVMLPTRRRDPRGGWRRGRIALVAGVGSALLSVGAAATGLLGVRVQNMPVITTIAEAVDAPRAAPKTVTPTPVRQALAEKKPVVTATSPLGAVVPTVITPQRRVAIDLADRIENRMRRRDALGRSVPSLARLEARRDRMIAMGDPRAEAFSDAIAILKTRNDASGLPQPRTQRQVNQARLAELPPEQREAFKARRMMRKQQREAAAVATADSSLPQQDAAEAAKPRQTHRDRWMKMSPEERAEWQSRRAAREAAMTPEQRERFEKRRAERRQRMLQGPDSLTGGPAIVPEESLQP